MSHLLDALVWVQFDAAEAKRHGFARDAAAGARGDVERATRFFHEWMAQEIPFVAAQTPWERADLVIRGTTADADDPAHVVLAPRPGGASSRSTIGCQTR